MSKADDRYIQAGGIGPSGAPFDITPSDTAGNELKRVARFITVSANADVAIVGLDGSTGIMRGLVPGAQYRANARQVLVTGTTGAIIIQGYP